MNKPLFQTHWQLDIAERALDLAQSHWIQSPVTDTDIAFAFKRLKSDMELINNTLQLYIQDDMENGKNTLGSPT
jgi:hypothetical protein